MPTFPCISYGKSTRRTGRWCWSCPLNLSRGIQPEFTRNKTHGSSLHCCVHWPHFSNVYFDNAKAARLLYLSDVPSRVLVLRLGGRAQVLEVAGNLPILLVAEAFRNAGRIQRELGRSYWCEEGCRNSGATHLANKEAGESARCACNRNGETCRAVSCSACTNRRQKLAEHLHLR